MNPNHGKIDEEVLALLHLTRFTDHGVTRAWKGHDWDSLDRGQEKGYIFDPKNKSKSVVFTEVGRQRAEQLFQKLFT